MVLRHFLYKKKYSETQENLSDNSTGTVTIKKTNIKQWMMEKIVFEKLGLNKKFVNMNE